MTYLEYQNRHNSDRNSDWFPRLIRDVDKYLFWTICFQHEKVVAFSTIQKHFFPDDTVRVLTRTFFDPSIRLNPGYNLWVETPVASMIAAQLKWLKEKNEFSKAMITMEPRHRLDYFTKIIHKINTNSGAKFIVLDKKFKTVPDQKLESYQHAAVMDLK